MKKKIFLKAKKRKCFVLTSAKSDWDILAAKFTYPEVSTMTI